jgi:hypothetical protein
MSDLYYRFRGVLSKKQFEFCHRTLFYTQAWRYEGTSVTKEGESDYNFWFMDLTHHTFFTETFLEKIQELTEQKFKLLRVYANGHTVGLPGSLHKDGEESDDFTFLYYANPEWNVTWNGGTVFYETQNKYEVAEVIPNSGVIFKGNTLHGALDISRKCKLLRVTVAFKLKLL